MFPLYAWSLFTTWVSWVSITVWFIISKIRSLLLSSMLASDRSIVGIFFVATGTRYFRWYQVINVSLMDSITCWFMKRSVESITASESSNWSDTFLSTICDCKKLVYSLLSILYRYFFGYSDRNTLSHSTLIVSIGESETLVNFSRTTLKMESYWRLMDLSTIFVAIFVATFFDLYYGVFFKDFCTGGSNTCNVSPSGPGNTLITCSAVQLH